MVETGSSALQVSIQSTKISAFRQAVVCKGEDRNANQDILRKVWPPDAGPAATRKRIFPFRWQHTMEVVIVLLIFRGHLTPKNLVSELEAAFQRPEDPGGRKPSPGRDAPPPINADSPRPPWWGLSERQLFITFSSCDRAGPPASLNPHSIARDLRACSRWPELDPRNCFYQSNK